MFDEIVDRLEPFFRGMTMTPNEWEKVLLKIAPQGKAWIVMGFADALSRYEGPPFEINTKSRQAHFIAQCVHECDHLRTTQEYASGAAYEGRKDLGNTHKGDGRRYKGRGLIQLTGRANYRDAGKALNQPFEEQPELVERFPAAADVSAWFWDTRKLNRHADADDVRQITKLINGGYNGLESRMAHLAKAKSAIV